MTETSTQKWRRINRSRFVSDDEFNRWQRDRKRKYRNSHRRKYTAELLRNRIRARLRYAQKPDVALRAMIEKLVPRSAGHR